MNFRNWARQRGVGRLLLKYWHQPIGAIRHSLRHGGPLAQRTTERHRREMENAAATLGALPVALPGAPTLHLMTGRRFWYQTVWCLHSFVQAAQTAVRVELYDDGTIDAEHAAQFARLGRDVHIHRQDTLRANLDTHLPRDRFPVLRERWDNYPNLRKLIDVHLASTGWKLVLDSDLVFFRRPDALLHWLAAPDRILHAVDCVESYGYSRGLLECLAGATLPKLLNVGICGLQSDAINWEELESWTAELHRREGTSYYLEQALVAMLAARTRAEPVSGSDYVTKPRRDEVLAPRAVMHHYVDTSKRWYFRYGWRHIAASVSPTSQVLSSR